MAGMLLFDALRCLGLNEGCTLEQLKAAYAQARRKASSGGSDVKEAFKVVFTALSAPSDEHPSDAPQADPSPEDTSLADAPPSFDLAVFCEYEGCFDEFYRQTEGCIWEHIVTIRSLRFDDDRWVNPAFVTTASHIWSTVMNDPNVGFRGQCGIASYFPLRIPDRLPQMGSLPMP